MIEFAYNKPSQREFYSLKNAPKIPIFKALVCKSFLLQGIIILKIRRILSLVLIILTGCVSSASGPAFTKHEVLAEDTALVYFYRPNLYDGVTVCWKIKIDDRYKGCLKPGGFIKIDLVPGEHMYFLHAAAVKFAFSESIQGKQAHYYEIDFYSSDTDLSKAKGNKGVHFIFNGIHAVLPVEESEALPKLLKLKQS